MNWDTTSSTLSFTDSYGGEWKCTPNEDRFILTLNGEHFQPNVKGWSQPPEGWSLDRCSFFVQDYLGQRKRREGTLHVSYHNGRILFIDEDF